VGSAAEFEEQALDSMPDGGRWSELLPLERAETGWRAPVLDAKGEPLMFWYSSNRGLEFLKEET